MWSTLLNGDCRLDWVPCDKRHCLWAGEQLITAPLTRIAIRASYPAHSSPVFLPELLLIWLEWRVHRNELRAYFSICCWNADCFCCFLNLLFCFDSSKGCFPFPSWTMECENMKSDHSLSKCLIFSCFGLEAPDCSLTFWCFLCFGRIFNPSNVSETFLCWKGSVRPEERTCPECVNRRHCCEDWRISWSVGEWKEEEFFPIDFLYDMICLLV